LFTLHSIAIALDCYRTRLLSQSRIKSYSLFAAQRSYAVLAQSRVTRYLLHNEVMQCLRNQELLVICTTKLCGW